MRTATLESAMALQQAEFSNKLTHASDRVSAAEGAADNAVSLQAFAEARVAAAEVEVSDAEAARSVAELARQPSP